MKNNNIHELKNLDWSFKEDNTTYLTHNFHPYPAKFIPQIPRTLIESLSSEGDTILDPFCGGGTTLVEAVLLNRNAIGTDTNPVGILSAKVKSTKLSKKELEKINNHIILIESELSLNKIQKKLEHIPTITNMDLWFSQNAINELSYLKSKISNVKNSSVKQFLELAFSSIIVKVSNQKGETTYSSKKKNLQDNEVIWGYVKKIKTMYNRIEQFSKLSGDGFIKTYIDDARYLKKIDDRIDLAITSPPYPNAFDYFLYHKHRISWLGYDPLEVKRVEIGSHLNYQSKNIDEVEEYKKDYTKHLKSIHSVLKNKAYYCIIIGDSKFHGKIIHNAGLIEDLAIKTGFEVISNIERSLPKNKRSFSFKARRIMKENIIILRKKNE